MNYNLTRSHQNDVAFLKQYNDSNQRLLSIIIALAPYASLHFTYLTNCNFYVVASIHNILIDALLTAAIIIVQFLKYLFKSTIDVK